MKIGGSNRVTYFCKIHSYLSFTILPLQSPSSTLPARLLPNYKADYKLIGTS